MASGPSKMLEAIAGILIPPACREEVLGDLYERYQSPAGYLADLLSITPFVILRRIRRTTDVRLLVMEAMLVYGSFLAGAWYFDRTLLRDEHGELRLAFPAGLTLAYLLISDAFSGPLKRSAAQYTRVLVVSAGLIILCMALGLLSSLNVFGFCSSVLLATTLRMVFPFGSGSPQRAGGPATRAGEGSESVAWSARLMLTVFCLVVVFLMWWNAVSTSKGVNP